MTKRTASCPNCGAPIEYRWSSSVQTVCEHCRSVVVRTDVDLKKVGVVADLPLDGSPIQLFTEGHYGDRNFVVAGRILYQYEQGTWNEWHIVLDGGVDGWLSDAQNELAVSFAVKTSGLPTPEKATLGKTFQWNDTRFTVVSRTLAHYAGVEGELPFEYLGQRRRDVHRPAIDQQRFRHARLQRRRAGALHRQSRGLRHAAPAESPNLRGLVAMSAVPARPPVTVRSVNCPNCGAATAVRTFGHAVNVVCQNCRSILDAKDAGVTILQRYKEAVPIEPLIPLGTRGTIRDVPYEVVGFQVRQIMVDHIAYRWREYLLFNPYRGFRYLTDTPATGIWCPRSDRFPTETTCRAIRGRDTVGPANYRHFQTAIATTVFVLGEFPWQVRVGDTGDGGGLRRTAAHAFGRGDRRQGSHLVPRRIRQRRRRLEVALGLPGASARADRHLCQPAVTVRRAAAGCGAGRARSSLIARRRSGLRIWCSAQREARVRREASPSTRVGRRTPRS